MSNFKDVTIYDLANQLGVSVATVSRALNDSPSVSKGTKRKISDLATKLGYRHNRFASDLRRQKTNTIGVMVPKLHSNFIASVLSGIEKVTAVARYDIIIAHSSESLEKEKANALNLFHKRVDGLIVSLSMETEDLNHFKRFEDRGLPIVFFDRVDEDSDTIKVIIDNYRCGYLATKHLIDEGCKRIVLVTSSLQRNVYARRWKGYMDAHAEVGLPVDEGQVLIRDFSEAGALECAKEIMQMKPLPDGVFITNDFVAAICMGYLRDQGIRIPEDIAFVGFNNDAISRIVEPRLTTIDYPGVDIGEIAAMNLINLLNGSPGLKQTSTIIARSELLIRESSRKMKTGRK